MNATQELVATLEQLLAAAANPNVHGVVVCGQIADVPSLRLAPGQIIEGENEHACLTFLAGQDGVQLSSDNEISHLRLETAPERKAIFNDTSVASLGHLRLYDVITVGQVQLLARDQIRSGHVEVDGLHVAAADTRAQPLQAAVANCDAALSPPIHSQ